MFSANTSQIAAGGGAVFVEDIFSTTLYTGNGSTQAITNGIDLAGEGGLVWIKARNTVDSHRLFDTTRGVGNYLVTNGTFAQLNNASSVTAFNSTGFDLGSFAGTNDAFNYASWTFREQPKFFDIVTWTHTGTNGRVINHSLGSTPGMIIVKNVTNGGSWPVWHRSAGTGQSGLYLESTGAFSATNEITNVNSTSFTLDNSFDCNGDTGATGIAYLFAHNAGGFGLTGTDNVISCGSWTGTGSNLAVNLGYEPQWLMFKRTDDVGDWTIVDNMRGFTTTGADAYLKPNTSGAETSVTGAPAVNATGFSWTTGAGTNFIYIAIRRGPMKVPTSGTSVFAPVLATTPSSPYTATTNFPVDLLISSATVASGKDAMDRLRGGTTTSFRTLFTNTTDAESVSSGANGIGFQSNTAVIDNSYWSGYGVNVIYWNFRRAPSFFDEVCYTGTGVARTLTHNLTVVPELMIVKQRSGATDWTVGFYVSASQGAEGYLNLTSSVPTLNWSSTEFNAAPTATDFSVSQYQRVNSSGGTYVAYLFATCVGVSKVGTYTGNGTTQTIDCGFTGGARFVLIKRKDAAGDWYVYDTARGMTTLTDPYLLLNSTAAETATLGSVTTVSTGFALNSSILAAINVSASTYIFFAVA